MAHTTKSTRVSGITQKKGIGRYGNPLQCSCLENPRDGGAGWAAVYGVAQKSTLRQDVSKPQGHPHSCPCPCHLREPGRLTATLGDIADPGQGLVTTLLNDLHVSDLERDERRWPRIGGKSRLGPAEHNTTSGNKKAQPGRNEVTRLRAKM